MKKATLQTVARDVRAIAHSIGAVQRRAAARNLVAVPSGRPALNEGEKYAGIILAKNGGQDHHLIKLPGEMSAKGGWDIAIEWAKGLAKKIAGASLPTRREQALMFANIPEEFQTDSPYWSSEEYAGLSSSAWCQWFNGGTQIHWVKDLKYRACAVRRVPI